jgi:hypothetical protein
MLILDADVDRSASQPLHVLRVGVIGRECVFPRFLLRWFYRMNDRYVFGFEDAQERQRFFEALESCGVRALLKGV